MCALEPIFKLYYVALLFIVHFLLEHSLGALCRDEKWGPSQAMPGGAHNCVSIRPSRVPELHLRLSEAQTDIFLSSFKVSSRSLVCLVIASSVTCDVGTSLIIIFKTYPGKRQFTLSNISDQLSPIRGISKETLEQSNSDNFGGLGLLMELQTYCAYSECAWLLAFTVSVIVRLFYLSSIFWDYSDIGDGKKGIGQLRML